MLGVPRELAEHSLDVSKTAKPVKQKMRHFAKDRKEVITGHALPAAPWPKIVPRGRPLAALSLVALLLC
jgi:hypothetical protein